MSSLTDFINAKMEVCKLIKSMRSGIEFYKFNNDIEQVQRMEKNIRQITNDFKRLFNCELNV